MAKTPNPPEDFNGHAVYRDPDTGRFITREKWESLGGDTENIFEDIDEQEYEEWDEFGEEEVY